MGFRLQKGRGLFECGLRGGTRLDIRADVRPRFSFRCLENSCVAFEPACLPVQLHRVKLSFSLLPRTARAPAPGAGALDSALMAWYGCLYAPRTGGAHDSHYRTAGI